MEQESLPLQIGKLRLSPSIHSCEVGDFLLEREEILLPCHGLRFWLSRARPRRAQGPIPDLGLQGEEVWSQPGPCGKVYGTQGWAGTVLGPQGHEGALDPACIPLHSSQQDHHMNDVSA